MTRQRAARTSVTRQRAARTSVTRQRAARTRYVRFLPFRPCREATWPLGHKATDPEKGKLRTKPDLAIKKFFHFLKFIWLIFPALLPANYETPSLRQPEKTGKLATGNLTFSPSTLTYSERRTRMKHTIERTVGAWISVVLTQTLIIYDGLSKEQYEYVSTFLKLPPSPNSLVL